MSNPADEEARAAYKEIGHKCYEAIIQVIESTLSPNKEGPYKAVVLATLARVTATVGGELCGLSPTELGQYVTKVAERPDLLVLIEDKRT